MHTIISNVEVVALSEELDIFVAWKFIPGRGPVPIAGRGERARIRKSGKSFDTAVDEASGKKKKGTGGAGSAKDIDDGKEFKELNSHKEAQAWADGTGFSDTTNKLSDDQADALYEYKAAAFEGINDSLRKGENFANEDVKDIADNLDDIMGKSSVPEDVKVLEVLIANSLAMIYLTHSAKVLHLLIMVLLAPLLVEALLAIFQKVAL